MFICLFSSIGLAFLQDQLRPEQKQQTEQQDTLSSLKH
jgi:preprotein translocase subunit YajC